MHTLGGNKIEVVAVSRRPHLGLENPKPATTSVQCPIRCWACTGEPQPDGSPLAPVLAFGPFEPAHENLPYVVERPAFWSALLHRLAEAVVALVERVVLWPEGRRWA